MKECRMNNFITILRFDDGLASYQVIEQRHSYSAALIKTTSQSAFPEEIVVDKSLTLKGNESRDPLLCKLVHAIKTTEANGDE